MLPKCCLAADCIARRGSKGTNPPPSTKGAKIGLSQPAVRNCCTVAIFWFKRSLSCNCKSLSSGRLRRQSPMSAISAEDADVPIEGQSISLATRVLSVRACLLIAPGLRAEPAMSTALWKRPAERGKKKGEILMNFILLLLSPRLMWRYGNVLRLFMTLMPGAHKRERDKMSLTHKGIKKRLYGLV